jgi:hypothetical protein
LTYFSSVLVEGGFFNIKASTFGILVAIPTKAQSKYMMRHKGKEQVEEGSSFAKITWKQTLVQVREIHKMF